MLLSFDSFVVEWLALSAVDVLADIAIFAAFVVVVAQGELPCEDALRLMLVFSVVLIGTDKDMKLFLEEEVVVTLVSVVEVVVLVAAPVHTVNFVDLSQSNQ